jgi:hypothetical protein
MASFDNAVIMDGILHVGGSNYQLMVDFPTLLPTPPFDLAIEMAQIVGDVAVDEEGHMSVANGMIGGAVKKQVVLDCVEALPEESLPVSSEMLKNLYDILLVNDIDSDGDGELDAVSVGMKFTSFEGVIVGLAD